MALIEAASRRLDFEQSRDDSATGSKQPTNVLIDFPTGSGNLTCATLLRASTSTWSLAITLGVLVNQWLVQCSGVKTNPETSVLK